jgi:hypothetical protein
VIMGPKVYIYPALALCKIQTHCRLHQAGCSAPVSPCCWAGRGRSRQQQERAPQKQCQRFGGWAAGRCSPVNTAGVQQHGVVHKHLQVACMESCNYRLRRVEYAAATTTGEVYLLQQHVCYSLQVHSPIQRLCSSCPALRAERLVSKPGAQQFVGEGLCSCYICCLLHRSLNACTRFTPQLLVCPTKTRCDRNGLPSQ